MIAQQYQHSFQTHGRARTFSGGPHVKGAGHRPPCSCLGNHYDFWGPRWASQSQNSLQFRCAQRNRYDFWGLRWASQSQNSLQFRCAQGNRYDFWGPRWASQSQNSLQFRCAQCLPPRLSALAAHSLLGMNLAWLKGVLVKGCFFAFDALRGKALQPRLPLAGVSRALRARNPERVSKESPGVQKVSETVSKQSLCFPDYCREITHLRA